MKNKNILQSIRCAARGIVNCYKQERNFGEYTVIALIFLIFNVLLSSELWEYIVYFSLIAAAFSAEFLNTAIERIIDDYDGSINEKNKFIKDAAAASVLVVSAAFFFAEGLILIPKLIARLS